MNKRLKVFYNNNQSTNDADTGFSPSAKKPAILTQQWLDTNQPIEIVSDFQPVTKEQYYRAHEKDHIDQILAGEKENGFSNTSLEIAATLPWTTGSLMAAALYAWKNKTITMSPTSGFHHATQNESMGFCTFNGLMTVALELLAQGASKIGILDLDHHYGNGTTDILKWIPTPSGHFHHYTVGGDLLFNKEIGPFMGRTYHVWKGGDATERWLKAFPEIVQKFEGCDIVLLQAGADPHIDDPCHAMLGSVGALNNEQFVQRDRMVFEGLTKLGIPIAWNLAGGYQTPLQKVLDIHTQTLIECLKVL